MNIEEVKEASTVEEMRAELFRQRQFNPVVQSVFTMADVNGLSGEDRYVHLAYLALRQGTALQNLMLDVTRREMIHHVVLPESLG